MRILLDTNILLRLSEKSHRHHPAAIESLRRLASQRHVFCIGSQTVGEFLAVATRPIADRGLGMDQLTADTQLSKVISALDVLYDSPAALAELRRLVVAHNVVGKSVHDARLVAAMNTNAVQEILTFNGGDFAPFQIKVLDASSIANVPSSSP